jgi:hypothetical protein
LRFFAGRLSSFAAGKTGLPASLGETQRSFAMTKARLLHATLRACYAGEKYVAAMNKMLERTVIGGNDPHQAEVVQQRFAKWSRLNHKALEMHRRMQEGG